MDVVDESEEPNRKNFITCLKFVKKGIAKTNPEKVQLTKEELVQVIEETKQKLSLTNQQGEGSGNSNPDEYNFNDYDEDNGESDAQALGISSLAELDTNAEDNFSESDDSDKEDEIIKQSDNLILVGHVEGDASCLEVYVYNEDEEALYVHHDIILPEFPLAIEWLNYEPNTPKGSYCALGLMDPVIQVWDLDIINCIEPAFKLGKGPSAKKNRARLGHSDAVLSLAWNATYDHILASGSVDKTILLWDMERLMPSTTITSFKKTIQCLQWHGLEAQTLLGGSCDKTARVFDCRAPESHKSWQLSGEIENVCWDPLQPFSFFAASNVGILHYVDCRKGEMWKVEAHEKEITGLSVSAQCPGLLVTTSPDGNVKTWDYTENGIELVNEKDFNLGNVLCMSLSPDSPFVMAAGGDNKSNNFVVHDLRNIDTVRNKFQSRDLMELGPAEETSN